MHHNNFDRWHLAELISDLDKPLDWLNNSPHNPKAAIAGFYTGSARYLVHFGNSWEYRTKIHLLILGFQPLIGQPTTHIFVRRAVIVVVVTIFYPFRYIAHACQTNQVGYWLDCNWGEETPSHWLPHYHRPAVTGL